eukprot:6940433-Alexandrium_andersonii.AAC.1
MALRSSTAHWSGPAAVAVAAVNIRLNSAGRIGASSNGGAVYMNCRYSRAYAKAADHLSAWLP